MPLIWVGAAAGDLQDARNAYRAGQFEEAASLLRPLVRKEESNAVYLLARMYEQGDGVSKDLDEAKRLYRIAANKGHDSAQQRLDIFDAQGNDESVVIEWYLPSAEEGDTEAQYNLAFMYETGWGVQVDEGKAVNWYQEAVEAHHDVAQLRLGLMQIVGAGLPRSIESGIALLRKSAENGNRIAEVLIQDMFDVGDVKQQDAIRIVSGLRRTLDEGENTAIEALRTSLASYYNKPKNSVTTPTTIRKLKNTSESSQFNLVKSVTSRNASVPGASVRKSFQNNTTNSFLEKKNTREESDAARAKQENIFDWYQAEAAKGDSDSQFHLGAMYIKGEQVIPDVEEGVHWIKMAAEQGHDMANIYLSFWDEDITANAFDQTIAVRWLKSLSRQWDIEAMFHLAFLFETGRGVKQNFPLALRWYRFAALEGHSEAKRRLALMKGNNKAIRNEGIQGIDSANSDALFIILGLVLVIGGCVGVFLYYKRNKSQNFSLPSLDSIDGELMVSAKPAQGLPDDDRKLFDELWSNSAVVEKAPLPKKSAPVVAEKKTAPVVAEGVSSEARAPKSDMAVVSENKPKKAEEAPRPAKTPELSEVEEKLAKAIDDLIALNPDAAKPAQLTQDKARDSKEEKTVAVKVDKVDKADVAIVETKTLSIHAKAVEIATDAASLVSTGLQDLPELINPAALLPSTIGIEPERKTSQEFNADAFMKNGISIDELAASRVSADSLFADGVAIDEEGTAIGRGNYNPSKIDASRMTFYDTGIENNISGSSISHSSQARPIGAAASLLPQQKADIEKEIKKPVKRIEIESSPIATEPVDLSAPMTSDEGRSLAEVHYNIGVMFSKGDGVPKNEGQAVKWFIKAAEEGLPEAQFSLGQYYLSGIGVSKNSALAMEWIQKAASQNYKPAQDVLQNANQAS